MGAFPALPPDYDSWTFDGGFAAARRDVAAAVREALAAASSLYAWARARPDREIFVGRGETYSVRLGGVEAVVRHAHRGGVPALFSADWFTGTPRFFRELHFSRHLEAAGVRTPDVLAGVAYRAGLGHRADVATQRVDGRDLAAIFFGDQPPEGEPREALWRAAGTLVSRLHHANLVHPDLQLRNVLIAPEPHTALPPYRPTAWLLDVDTCRPCDPRDDAARRRNLARFYRSWDKWNQRHGSRLTAHDRATLEAAYQEGSGS